jgi:hypothetical protein
MDASLRASGRIIPSGIGSQANGGPATSPSMPGQGSRKSALAIGF